MSARYEALLERSTVLHLHLPFETATPEATLKGRSRQKGWDMVKAEEENCKERQRVGRVKPYNHSTSRSLWD